MSKDLVIFGPWCGEFSYEFQWWVPEIRKKRYTQFKDFYAIHIGYEGRSILYRDFIDEYLDYPKELEDTLLYPSNFAQYFPERNGVVEIPNNIKLFLEECVEERKNLYNSVGIYLPSDLQYRCYEDNPYGEFIHYNASEKILNEMKNEIQFEDSSRRAVAILARVRYREGNVDKNDWNPKCWESFIDMLINLMNLNVCVIDIPPRSSNGGSLSFVDSEMYRRNKRYIKSIRFEGKDSVEKQIALLQLVDCNISGVSGAATLPYFTKTPVFIQQTKKESRRKKFQWQRDLTNNLKNVCIYDEHGVSGSPEEMFICFRNFFLNEMGRKLNV